MESKSKRKIVYGHVVDVKRDKHGTAFFKEFRQGELEIGLDHKISYCGLRRTDCQSEVCDVYDFKDSLLMPSFSDIHLHFPQYEMIGSHGEDLLGWLNRYTFPIEMKYSDLKYAQSKAKQFVGDLVSVGTTSAAIYSSSHFESTNALLDACNSGGLRAVVGQVAMNRHAPDALLTKDLHDYEKHFSELFRKWHVDDGRLKLAVTPRFAPTCSDDLLNLCGQLLKGNPGAFLQTHFAETQAEIDWVQSLFPKSRDYLDVYETYDLCGVNSILGHGIHVTKSEMERLNQTRTAIAHCPSSNLFLGSGVMNWKQMREQNIRFALSTDIGAGTSICMWDIMGDAYKSQKLMGHTLTAADLFAASSIDGAEILFPEYQSFGFDVGARADFQVLNARKNRFLEERLGRNESIDEVIFGLIWSWTQSMVDAVFIDGDIRFESGKCK
ncbi:MAG: guanine deaminase [Proteobacteria bacterium]|nr:guanine deaminase [Pseudomonadota bacterium]